MVGACAALEPLAGTWKAGLALLAVVSWSVGVVFYAAVGIFAFLRLMVYRIHPRELGTGYFGSICATA